MRRGRPVIRIVLSPGERDTLERGRSHLGSVRSEASRG
jgi:hypothetical protein